jgi:hypothetical protein
LEPRRLESVVVMSLGEEGFVPGVVVLEPRRLENRVIMILLSDEEFVPGVEVSEPRRLENRAIMSPRSGEGFVVPLPTETTEELQPGIAFDGLPPEGISLKLAPFV